MNVVPVQINYNQEFDKTEYPLEQWHRDTVARIHHNFRLPISTTWSYDATLHGRVFTARLVDPKRSHLYGRLNVERVQFLASLPGFRWIEYRDGCVMIGIEHQQPAEFSAKCDRCGRIGTAGTVGETCRASGVCTGTMA